MQTQRTAHFQIQAGSYQFTFLNTGDIYEIAHGDIMINQWLSNPIDGSFNNIYLRLFKGDQSVWYPLVGRKSNSHVSYTNSQVIFVGEVEDIQYKVVFTLTEKGIWFWDVTLEGYDGETDAEVIYGQDVGLAHKGAVRTNEAFVSQYIDHQVFQDEAYGYVVCSRQNQPQVTAFPYLQQGSLTGAVAYSTDGFQFFGHDYKETHIPVSLVAPSLANKNYQYEFAYTALQSQRKRLDGNLRFVFYGCFSPDHPEAVTEIAYKEEIKRAWEEITPSQNENVPSSFSSSDKLGEPLRSQSLTRDEIHYYFPSRHQEEYKDETLLSFFTDKHEHVVLREKELLVERPHGHILMTGQNDALNSSVLTTTSYMYGVFNSQVVLGNTSFNKMMTNTRNALNISKTSGQRIYIEKNGAYHLLAMPSLFEMGFNYVRWFYKTEDDLILITNYTVLDRPEIHLKVQSVLGRPYRYVVTNQISMNNNEYDVPFHVKEKGQKRFFYADAHADSGETHPKLCYTMEVSGAEVTNSDLFTEDEMAATSLVSLEIEKTSAWTLSLQGSLDGEEKLLVEHDEEQEKERYRTFYKEVMNEFSLSHPHLDVEVEKVNDVVWWYTHNMLVHYSVPHGLEQYGGAAWGTRDVCQGPTEYFLATHHYESVKEIIKTVYSHQYEGEGNWPQWFMFDQYASIQQQESHGDVIVWPLKIVSDYLNATNDYALLQETIPYTREDTFGFTDQEATILDHIHKQVAYIERNFLHGTALSSYGDGDWDDTLQPANAQLKKYMISSWTVALTYQVFDQFSKALKGKYEKESTIFADLASRIQTDYNRYILTSSVIPGFIYMEEEGVSKKMLHPEDEKTGIHYRLLPMTRSMISELLTPEQAQSHYEVIKRELDCPDGVRLMNRPAQYKGGVSTNFKRAEQAANFGREVGLQYVHAHIRFVEAMAKIGKEEEVWSGLAKINPVGIQQVVLNADYRQSNAYFSSSDGNFSDRYEAQARFDELRNGEVKVKGGWRIYSSGPGIYINQLISNCLGTRQEGGDLILDPVLPKKLDGLSFSFTFNRKPVTILYHLTGNDDKRVDVNGVSVKITNLHNSYRAGGLRISKEELAKYLKGDQNTIDLFL